MVHATAGGKDFCSVVVIVSTDVLLQRLEDDLHVSTLLHTNSGGDFIDNISNSEILIDSVLALCHPEQYRIGMEAIRMLKYETHKWHPNVSLWLSVFSGIGVIVNRVTPAHHDRGVAAPVFNLLASMGTHTSATICLPDVQADLNHYPGTIVVDMWEGIAS